MSDVMTSIITAYEDRIRALDRKVREANARADDADRELEEEEGRSDDYNEAYKQAIVRAENAEADLVDERLRTEAADRKLATAREALERIAGSRLNDFMTLHPESCSQVAQETLAALQDQTPLNKEGEKGLQNTLPDFGPSFAMVYHAPDESSEEIKADLEWAKRHNEAERLKYPDWTIPFEDIGHD